MLLIYMITKISVHSESKIQKKHSTEVGKHSQTSNKSLKMPSTYTVTGPETDLH